MLTRKDFRLSPETGKRNLALCSAELLYTLAGEGASEKLRIPCIAELISRRFLNRRDNQLAEAIDKLLPNGERKSLERTLDEDFLNKPSKETLEKVLWQTDNDFSRKCHTAVSRRLISLCCETDGFIPVYSGEKAFGFRTKPALVGNNNLFFTVFVFYFNCRDKGGKMTVHSILCLRESSARGVPAITYTHDNFTRPRHFVGNVVRKVL